MAATMPKVQFQSEIIWAKALLGDLSIVSALSAVKGFWQVAKEGWFVAKKKPTVSKMAD